MSSSLMPFYTSKCTSGQYKMPFWSAMDTYVEQVEMQQDYYEVEIYSDRNYEEQLLMDKILNMTTYKCNVCNIDVPKTSAKNHIQSIKHETCLKITQIALERANLHMKAEFIDASQVEVKDTYFCDHCALVIQNSDKDKHERSNRHVNSVKSDKLLQELVSIYENPLLDCEQTVIKMSENNFDQILRQLMNPIVDITEIVHDIETNESLALNTSNIEINEHSNKENEETSKIVPKSKKKKTNKKKKKTNINEMQSNYPETNVKTKKENYRENDVEESKADINKLEKNKVDPNKITSEEKTDDLNIGLQQQQHHYIKHDETHNALNASNNNMTDIENEETSKILKTLYKKSNKRKPKNRLQVDIEELETKTKENNNNEMEMQETILSEESIQIKENLDKNMTSENDSNNSLIEKEGPPTSYKEKDSFNEPKYVLNVISKGFPNSVTVSAWSEDVVEIIANDGKKFRIPQLNFHGYRVVKNDVVCTICPESNCQPNHKWKEVHKTKIMAPLDKHCVRKVSDTLSHCILCNITLLHFEIAVHVSRTKHTVNLRKYAVPQCGNQDAAAVQIELSKKIITIAIKNNLILTDDGAAMFCNICEIIIEKNRDCILTHVQSDTHIEKVNLLLINNRIEKMNDEYYCVICEKGIWGCLLSAHCKLEKHIKKLSLMEKIENDI